MLPKPRHIGLALTCLFMFSCKTIKSPNESAVSALDGARAPAVLQKFVVCGSRTPAGVACLPFDPMGVGFNGLSPAQARANMLVLAYASSLAYESGDIVNAWVANSGFAHAHYFNGDFVEAYLLEHDDFNIIVFRGTELTKQEWLTNLDARINPLSAPAVHHGFGEAFSWIRRTLALNAYVFSPKAADGSRKPVWLTGHSLGAAMATMAAMSMVDNAAMPPIRLMTFGGPRVMSHRTADLLSDKLQFSRRIVFANDIVTNLPAIALGYAHVRSELYFDAKCTLRDEEASTLLSKTWRMLRGSELAQLFNVRGIGAHSLDNYIRCTEQR